MFQPTCVLLCTFWGYRNKKHGRLHVYEICIGKGRAPSLSEERASFAFSSTTYPWWKVAGVTSSIVSVLSFALFKTPPPNLASQLLQYFLDLPSGSTYNKVPHLQNLTHFQQNASVIQTSWERRRRLLGGLAPRLYLMYCSNLISTFSI